MTALEGLDAPEVERFADVQVIGVSTAASQTDATDQAIEKTAHGPCKGKRIPATFATDSLDHPPHVGRSSVHMAITLVELDITTAPCRVGRQWVRWRIRPCRVGPACFHRPLLDLLQSETHGLFVTDRCQMDDVLQVVFAGNDRIAQRFHEGLGNRLRHGSHDVHPVTRESRSEHGDRHDEPLAQSGNLGVAVHHLAVGEHFGSGDIETPVGSGGQVECGNEISQYVPHGDRCNFAVDPSRSHHGGQPLGEIAQHLERRTSRADDHARLQHDGRNGGVEENLTHFCAGSEMLRDLFGVRRNDSPEIDDPLHACVRGCIGKIHRGNTIRFAEVTARPDGVHEVVHGVNPVDGLIKRASVEDVTLHDGGPVTPRNTDELGGITREADDVVTRIEQHRCETSTDVAGGPGDEYAPSHMSSVRSIRGSTRNGIHRHLRRRLHDLRRSVVLDRRPTRSAALFAV